MNDLKQQVRAAKRRLQLQQLLTLVPWTMTVTLTMAGLAILATKIWPLPVNGDTWAFGWLTGGLVVGLLAALLATYVRREDDLDAAIEIDQRFGLKERVASCLTLSDQEQQTAAGQALISDAQRRVAQVEVNQGFRVSTGRWAWLPCLLAVVAFGLTLLSDAQPDALNKTAQAKVSAVEKKTVKNSAQQLIKKSEQLKREALAKGLEDAGDLFKELGAGLESIQQKEDVDRQKALVKLNDLAKQVQDRQRALLKRDDLRKQLNGLKDIKQGPADRMARAIKKGDFQTAREELAKLQQAMQNGELSEEEKQQMKQQLQQLQQKLQQVAEAHDQAKRDLQQQIEQKLAQGDREAASQLQKQLDKLNNQQPQFNQLGKMANKMADAAQAMEQGNLQDAEAALGQLADGLEAMQLEMEEMELLEDALGQIQLAKDSMNCGACQGMGCQACQGSMAGMGGMGQGQGMGDGMGEGQGRGDRPEEESQFGTYDSQVRAKPGRGRAVMTGTAFGPNQPGQAIEEIKTAIESARGSKDDPLTGQRLPKPQRELTREYFGALNE